MKMAQLVDNPFFARLWSNIATREPESVRRLRRENLAGLVGRVLEVGAGTGTNFELYPATVTEVVALEPERRLAEIATRAAASASVPVTVTTDTVEDYRRRRAVRRGRLLAGAVLGRRSRRCSAATLLDAAARRRTALPRARRQPGCCGRRCRGWPTRPSGRACWATATPIATPNGRSSARASRCARRATNGRCRLGADAGVGGRHRPGRAPRVATVTRVWRRPRRTCSG